MIETAQQLRAHAAVIATDLLALRQAIDAKAAGFEHYAVAVSALAAGLSELQQLAQELERGVVPRRRPGPTEAPGAHGDLIDGALITLPPSRRR